MVGEYKVSRCTRHCHGLDRPLREGEWYYSVVLEKGDEFERRDYSAESWQGPPAGAIGWWKSKMPTAAQNKQVLAPPKILIDMLRQMERFPEQAKSRYLLALLLMRKKIVKPAGHGELLASDTASLLRVEVVADSSTIDIPICEINRAESESLREQLNQLLYTEVEPEHDLDAQ